MQQKTSEGAGEIDFARTLLKLWFRRKWIAGGTAGVIFVGSLYAFLAPPLYRSETTIALREAGEGGLASFALSQFGGAGGVIASHLGAGSNALDKVDVVLKSWDFLDDLVEENNLLPRLFSEDWDGQRKVWKKTESKYISRNGSERLRKEYVTVRLDPKRSLIDIIVETPDPRLSKDLAEMYLEKLNTRIREDIVSSSEANRTFLEAQLVFATDPIVREKIQQLIGSEIEKAMLVSSNAFDVVIRPLLPLGPSAPDRFGIIVKSILFGIFLSLAASFAWDGYQWLRMRILSARAG